jgi:hypothetical protein
MAGADSAEFSETALRASLSELVLAERVCVKTSRKSRRNEPEILGLIVTSKRDGNEPGMGECGLESSKTARVVQALTNRQDVVPAILRAFAENRVRTKDICGAAKMAEFADATIQKMN